MLNPFSSNFMQFEPDKAFQREIEASHNSFGHDEETINWKRLANGYGQFANDHEPLESTSIIFDGVFQSKRQRINCYRNLALYPLVNQGLTIMADESVCQNSDGEVATFDLKNYVKNQFTETEYITLKQEFNYIMENVIKSDNVWDLYYKWLVDAEMFWEICLSDDGKKVAGIKTLPPYCMAAIYNDFGTIEGFIEDVSILYGRDPQDDDIKTFDRDQIAYSNYGLWFNNRNDVRGHLERVVRFVNQLRALEDALIVSRISRAPEKRLWNVYVGKMQVSKIPGYLNQIKNQCRKQLNIDPNTGMIQSNLNTQSFSEDYWFTKNDDGNGTSVESFKQGTEFNGQLDDLNNAQWMVMTGMLIPNVRWNKEEQAGATYNNGIDGVSMTEASFQKMNKRLRKKFASMIKQVFMVHIKARNLKSKFLDPDIYNIDLIPATDFEKMRELSLAEKRTNVLTSLTTFLPTGGNVKNDSEELEPLFSKQFLLEYMLGMTTDEFTLNNKMLEREVAEKKAMIEAVTEEGGDEDDGGDDLGF